MAYSLIADSMNRFVFDGEQPEVSTLLLQVCFLLTEFQALHQHDSLVAPPSALPAPAY